MSQKYLRPETVEQNYPVTQGQLAQMRYTGKGPRYFKPAARTILYRPEDIEEWIESTARFSTAEAS